MNAGCCCHWIMVLPGQYFTRSVNWCLECEELVFVSDPVTQDWLALTQLVTFAFFQPESVLTPYLCISCHVLCFSTVIQKVAPSPLVLVPAGNVSFDESGTLQLSCSSYGYPPPTLYWQRNDIAVVNSATSKITVEMVPYVDRQIQVNSTLQIAGLLPNDEGKYFCVASSEEGTNRASVEVHVRRKLLIFCLIWSI